MPKFRFHIHSHGHAVAEVERECADAADAEAVAAFMAKRTLNRDLEGGTLNLDGYVKVIDEAGTQATALPFNGTLTIAQREDLAGIPAVYIEAMFGD